MIDTNQLWSDRITVDARPMHLTTTILTACLISSSTYIVERGGQNDDSYITGKYICQRNSIHIMVVF